MADNVTVGSNSYTTRQVTYSGDLVQCQVVCLGFLSGSDDAKAVVDWTGDATYGVDVDVTRLPSLPTGANVIGGVTQSGSWSVSAAAALPVTDNSGSLTVDAPVGTPVFVRLSDGASPLATLPVSVASVPSHDVTNAGTFAVQASQSGAWDVGTVTTITNVVHVDDNAGSLTVDAPVATPVFVRLSDGASAIATLPVSLASVPSHDVTNAGTFAVQAAGDVAHDTADSGAPVKVGHRAIAHGANPTAVAAADRTDSLANRAGIPFVIGGHPNIVSYTHTAITTAVTNSALVSVAAGLKPVVTRISVTLDAASTVFPSVRIGFGTANVPALGNAGIIAAHGGIPAGGGFTVGDGSGILGVGADDEDIRITTVGNATGNGLQVTVSFYTVES